jgi:hypothetical protein
MRVAAALLGLLLLPSGSDRTKELAGLPRCQGKPALAGADWVRHEQREGFSLRLPACFQPDTETPRFVHGGERWRCKDTTAEVVWGMWGQDSFDERDRCQTQLAGVPVMVARRAGEGAGVLVWYLTGTVHEPIISAFSKSSGDRDLVEGIARSGERRPTSQP